MYGIAKGDATMTMLEVVRTVLAVVGILVFLWVILPTTFYMCSKFIRRGWLEANTEQQKRNI